MPCQPPEDSHLRVGSCSPPSLTLDPDRVLGGVHLGALLVLDPGQGGGSGHLRSFAGRTAVLPGVAVAPGGLGVGAERFSDERNT